MGAVEGEERHAADAQLAGGSLVGAHRVGVSIAAQHRLDLAGVQAGLAGQASQYLGFADGLAVTQVGDQKPLFDRVLQAALGGQVQQAVGVERVAGLGDVQAERQPLLGGHGGHEVLELLGALLVELVLVGQMLHQRLGAPARRRRIELVAAPPHVDVVAVSEVSQRRLEAALADGTPRAHDVGPDLDLHRRLLDRDRIRGRQRPRRRKCFHPPASPGGMSRCGLPGRPHSAGRADQFTWSRSVWSVRTVTCGRSGRPDRLSRLAPAPAGPRRRATLPAQGPGGEPSRQGRA
jgi:hypothetical protein